VAVGATAGAAVFSLGIAVAVPVAISSPAAIASVTFTGGDARPTITIHGHGLGTRPRPNPAYAPVGHPPLCPPQPTKPVKAYGLDYGTSLFLEDRTQSPAWSAGRYRPHQNELDCIGVIVVRFTPSTVVLRLGAFYTEGHFQLAEGDGFRVQVNAARYSGRVRYG
jgi:hypothetical protein